MPLENRQAKGEFESAKLEKAKYILLLKKAERQILTQINNRVMQVNTAIERAATNKEVVKLQGKKLKAEERSFQFGRSSSDLLIRYQEDLLEARLALAASLYEYKLALIDLKLTQNALLDEHWKEDL
jgi:outer membrane protein TolC